MGQHALIIGAGDTGTRIARASLERGWRVTGLVRSTLGMARVRATGAQPVVHDLDTPLPQLPAADVIFYCAPPPPRGIDDLRLAAILTAYPAGSIHRLIYISTSGVYGDCGGAWVDETRALHPTSGRARRRVAAETRIGDWGGDYAILRAPGIYGPGRLPIERVRTRAPVLSNRAGPWTNRIHVADLAAIAMAAAASPHQQAIYNAADGRPLPMGDYYRLLASQLGYPAPPEIDWAAAEEVFGATRLSFLRESRRLDNQRLRERLGYTLCYPDLASGLKASLAATDHTPPC